MQEAPADEDSLQGIPPQDAYQRCDRDPQGMIATESRPSATEKGVSDLPGPGLTEKAERTIATSRIRPRTRSSALECESPDVAHTALQ